MRLSRTLDRPIRQGQQRYPHLVWQLKKTEAEIMVKLTEEQITSKYGANCGLKPELSGALYQLVARVFKVLSGKKVFTTGKFRSSDGRHAVSCSVKASTGQLYPLERSLAFIHKPTSLAFEDISAVEFERFTGYGHRPPKTSTSTSTRGLSSSLISTLRGAMPPRRGDPSRDGVEVDVRTCSTPSQRDGHVDGVEAARS